jgi:hypothetical protein
VGEGSSLRRKLDVKAHPARHGLSVTVPIVGKGALQSYFMTTCCPRKVINAILDCMDFTHFWVGVCLI